MAKKKSKPQFHCTLEFYRAAVHRLNEARWILENSTYTTAGVYLAGYAIECALKSVLMANTPAAQHVAAKRSFRGKIAHDYDWLSRRLHQQRVVVPDLVAQYVSRVNWWSTDMRYQSAEVRDIDAKDFLLAATAIVAWARRSI